MKKICVVVGSRANYSSIKSAMKAIQNHPALELQLVVAASAILDRYGSVAQLIEQDGFKPNAAVNMLIEGETPLTMAKSTGLGLLELPTVFDQLNPDIVLTVGDRFETMSTAVAAVFMNITLAHTMGGEVSGTIDESTRHAITKLAHIHFPASADAANRIRRMGELEKHIHTVGCPRIDLIADIMRSEESPNIDDIMAKGVGDKLNLEEPFLLVSQHPVTTEYGQGKNQIFETLEAVSLSGIPAIVLWPNADAGSDDISKGMRIFREQGKANNMHFFKNLPIDVYIKLMMKTICLIGNSSSGIRDAAFIGTPVINIGTRQQNRERGDNVVDADYDRHDILSKINLQKEHGHYCTNSVYGDGEAGKRIAEILAKVDPEIQKYMSY